jgi:AcrR family transcriptional regulator
MEPWVWGPNAESEPRRVVEICAVVYNHFQSKHELFHAAVEDALDTFGARLDELTVGLDDPAEVLAQSFRLAARLHRREPELSKVLLHHGLALVGSDSGLAPWARRDIDAAVHAGRFRRPRPRAEPGDHRRCHPVASCSRPPRP